MSPNSLTKPILTLFSPTLLYARAFPWMIAAISFTVEEEEEKG